MADIIDIAAGDGDDRAGVNDDRVWRQHFSVSWEYPVWFTRDVFHPDRALLWQVLDPRGDGLRRRIFVAIDRGVAEANPGLIRRIRQWCHQRQSLVELVGSPVVLAGGEAVKSDWATVQDVMLDLGNQHMDRQSFVLAIGGGSFLDVVGFATALVHRGLRLVRMPSTVLAQNDAGVGVKNGMNEHGVKNFVGTFAPPWAVIDDFSLLETLPQIHWTAGLAEAFKVAIIKDRKFFDFLSERAPSIRQRDAASTEESIRRCAVLHLRHIAESGDPFELGTARPLDFGHWAAHRLETLSEYRIPHGAAVAAGIALDSLYARRKELISARELERILSGLVSAGLAIWYPELEERDAKGQLAILAGLDEFREHLGGRLTITLPRGIGDRVEVHEMNREWVEEAVVGLRARAGTAGGAGAG